MVIPQNGVPDLDFMHTSTPRELLMVLEYLIITVETRDRESRAQPTIGVDSLSQATPADLATAFDHSSHIPVSDIPLSNKALIDHNSASPASTDSLGDQRKHVNANEMQH